MYMWGVRECVLVITGVRGCEWVGVRRYADAMCWCVRVCTNVLGLPRKPKHIGSSNFEQF